MLRASITLLLLVASQPPAPRGARATVDAAKTAFANGADAAAAAERRWRDRLGRDSTDREALLGLAALARLRSDSTVVARLTTRLAPAGAPIADRYAVWALILRAHIAQAHASMAEARDQYSAAERAALTFGDSGAAAEALLSSFDMRARSDGLSAGMAALDTADRLIVPADLSMRASSRCSRAILFAVGGDAKATDEGRAGVALATQSGDRREEAFCQSALAHAYIARGDAGAALAPLRAAAALERGFGELKSLASTLQWLGDAEITVGQLAAARRDITAAIDDGRASGNVSALAWARQELGLLSLTLGDLPAAARELTGAESLFVAQGDQFAIARARAPRVLVAQLAGRLSEARAICDSALVEAVRSGDHEIERDLRLSRAHLALADGDAARAHAEMRRASALGRVSGDSLLGQGRSHAFGVFALETGDPAGAERIFRRELAHGESADYRGRFAAGVGVAQVYLLRGDAHRAAAVLDTATRALDDWRATLDEPALRVQAYREHVAFGPADHGLAAALTALVAAGEVESAFALAERQRARELLDALVRSRIARTDSLGGSARLRSVTARTIDAATLVAALPDDSTALIEYIAGRGTPRMAVFVATRRGVRGIALPGIDSLAGRVALFASLVEAGAPADSLGAALASVLVEPALVGLPATVRRLVIVPDDALYRLPFDALRTADGRTMLERFALSEAPSAGVAARLWSRPHARRAAVALVFGDPMTTDLPTLPEAAAEARAVARYAPEATVLLRGAASEARLKREPLARYAVLHFAAHAVVDDDAVDRTALALSPGEGEDGWVSPDEVAGLGLDADLVVLSGCRTARGQFVSGEGRQGLTAPFLAAGARAVVASRWRVGDQQASAFMQTFYAALAAGDGVGDALRRAQLRALRAGASPHDWAAFTVIGDPFAHPSLRVPVAPRAWAWVAAVALLLAALAYGLTRKRTGGAARSVPSGSRARTSQ